MKASAVFCQRRHQFLFPEIVLSGDQLVHQSLNGIERFRGRHAVGPTSLVPPWVWWLMPATAIFKNSSRLILKMVKNFNRSINGCVGACASSRTAWVKF